MTLHAHSNFETVKVDDQKASKKGLFLCPDTGKVFKAFDMADHHGRPITLYRDCSNRVYQRLQNGTMMYLASDGAKVDIAYTLD